MLCKSVFLYLVLHEYFPPATLGILQWNIRAVWFLLKPDELPQRRFLRSDDSLGVCVGPTGPSSAGFLTSSTRSAGPAGAAFRRRGKIVRCCENVSDFQRGGLVLSAGHGQATIHYDLREGDFLKSNINQDATAKTYLSATDILIVCVLE